MMAKLREKFVDNLLSKNKTKNNSIDIDIS